ncbi:MAG: glycine oxidase ThiO [Actinomycetota bacterium]|nr:glycine oxidase ThiO [Actinomycetota bacterium]
MLDSAPRSADVVVVGAGLIGLAVAWRAACTGLSVVVVDPTPGTGASQAAAGMLAPVAEASYGEESLLELSRASLLRYPAFVEDVERASGQQVGLRTAGTVVVGFDADDVHALDELHRFQCELGLDVERLGARDCRRVEPALTPRLRSGLRVRGDHSVDGRALHAALLVAGERQGVHLVAQRVRALRVADGRVTGVELADGAELAADTVVVAAGAWSAQLPGLPAGALPVRPVKGQILRLRGDAREPLLTGTVRALVRGRHVYLVPYGRDGLIVGATVEEMGFDATVTAGAVFELLRDAIEVVPGVAELELVETLARWRPGTPDNAPLLGPTGVPGLVAATGHHRNGVLLTPVTADVIASLLVTGAPAELAAPFAPDRFSVQEVSP